MDKEKFLDGAKTYIEVKGDHYNNVETLNKTMIARAQNVYTGETRRKERPMPGAALRDVINKMIEGGIICQPQDLCLIFKLDAEIPCMGFLSAQDFVTRLPKLVPEVNGSELMPNANHFKNLNLGSKNYPDWPWDTFPQRGVAHCHSVCDTFINAMAALGFVHPSMG